MISNKFVYQCYTIYQSSSQICTQTVLLHYVKSLSQWGRVMHICFSKVIIIGSDNGLWPGRCQAIIWTNAWILLIGLLGTNFSEILIETDRFSFKKMHLKMSSGKWRPSCLGLNVLKLCCICVWEYISYNPKPLSNYLCEISKMYLHQSQRIYLI